MKSDIIYLDHAAATPLNSVVFAAMQPYFTDRFYNPSSPYSPAVEVRRDYEAAKQCIAEVLGVKKDELVITAGATESINLAFSSAAGHVVTSDIEHHAVLRAAEKHDYTLAHVGAKGILAAETVAQALRPETTLVSIALVNNELGTIQPIRKIASVIEAERARRRAADEMTPLYFHSDGSQAAGHLDLHAKKLGLDMLTLNAGKMYGPKQVGLLWIAPRVFLAPQIVGGGQERGLRSGTENVAGVIGMAEALARVEKHRANETKRLGKIRDALQSRLESSFPDAVVSGDHRQRLNSFLHISFPGLDAERLVFALEIRGVLLATGSACAANQGTRSHVLTAIGLPSEVADGSLRISLGELSTEENIARAAVIITEELQREYARIHK